MALNTSKCDHLMPMRFEGLIIPACKLSLSSVLKHALTQVMCHTAAVVGRSHVITQYHRHCSSLRKTDTVAACSHWRSQPCGPKMSPGPPPPTVKKTGQESGGEFCRIFKLLSFSQSESVNNVYKLIQLLKDFTQVPYRGFSPGFHWGGCTTAPQMEISGIATAYQSGTSSSPSSSPSVIFVLIYFLVLVFQLFFVLVSF